MIINYHDTKYHYVYHYRESADTYHKSDWVKQYWNEFQDADKTEWHSYTYWRRKPFESNLINIDAQGIRKTWQGNSGVFQNTGAQFSVVPKVFLFGGSTMWGVGARDDFTIPSLIAKELAKNSLNPQLVNFGESGYISTQEVILLIRELQKGNIPKVVIFYDGVNDTSSASLQNKAGFPQNEINRMREFNASKRMAENISSPSTWAAFALNLNTVRVLELFLKKISGGKGIALATHGQANITLDNSPHSPEYLAKEVINIYATNVEIVQALANRYNFKALFYWQPTIFQKNTLTNYENREKQKELRFEALVNTSYEILKNHRIATSGDFDFHNLSAIFSNVSDPIFIDWCHLGETGNQYIAEAMAKDVRLSLVGPSPANKK